MRSFFLSASIPDPRRDARYYVSMDVIAIRDAIRALATVIFPHGALVWGGHPSITPLIRMVAESMGVEGSKKVQLFQTAWFSKELPEDNAVFEHYDIARREATLEQSILLMREKMLGSATFEAAIFIGGMEGVEEEFKMFRLKHPNASVYPVASTGAAARIIYEKQKTDLALPRSLADDYAYASLFRDLLDLPSRRSFSSFDAR